MRQLGISIVLVLVACSGEDNDGTNSQPDAGPSCSPMADTCAGETICVGGACVAAFPRVYSISGLQHMVPTTKPDSSSWDAGGGAPDLFVTITVNGALSATTTAVADQFSASWVGPFNVSLIAGSSLVLQSYDEDVTTHDAGYTCEATPITAALLRQRQLACAQGWSLSFSIAPQ